ncbi:MAG TPA: alpha/beta hydrolase-fold protein [Thermomicrobiales bacterium]|nr:alpha/beta hydrolase-fold protein [Thermomicrobiales bacterium]HRA32823.1 alpha/beta hydrolase-fold protein [Thermomicrobiales bacterium]
MRRKHNTVHHHRRWLRRAAVLLSVVSVAGLLLGIWGYTQGWDRYIHYRRLPDWGRSHEQALLQSLSTPPANTPPSAGGLANAAPAATAQTTSHIDMMTLGNGAVQDGHFDSATLGKSVAFRIYLPPGYDDPRFAQTRYPVVFLLHGSPGGCGDWVDGASADQTADALIRSGTIRPVIIVMPDGSLGDPHHDTQWGNSPVTGERVEAAIIDDLIPVIDQQYRTIARRDARAIGGLSSGGYGSINIALHHPETFGVAFSLSGYFKPTNTYDGHDIWGSDAARSANSPISQVHSLAQPMHILLMEGLDEGQGVADTNAFDAKLTQSKIDHRTLFAAGGHSWEFWKTHLLDALEYANQHFPATANNAASVTGQPITTGGGTT